MLKYFLLSHSFVVDNMHRAPPKTSAYEKANAIPDTGTKPKTCDKVITACMENQEHGDIPKIKSTSMDSKMTELMITCTCQVEATIKSREVLDAMALRIETMEKVVFGIQASTDRMNGLIKDIHAWSLVSSRAQPSPGGNYTTAGDPTIGTYRRAV